ncbi:MAG: GAF domain-containing sensor histidine kinase [Ilumatobacteraceae bacterium]
MDHGDNLNEQLASLHSISVEIAGLHELSDIHDLALGYCLQLTDSQFAFTGLLRDTNVGVAANGEIEVSNDVMDVAAIKGFHASPDFYDLFHLMALRSSVVGVAIKENRSYITNDVEDDPHAVGLPDGHPPVRRFLGVPLRLGQTVIGMIGVANKRDGYGPGDEQLLATFASQVAVAVDNARLYERQRETIAELQQLHERLTEVEQTQLLGRERERIAGDLHDRLEQRIFTIGVRLNALVEPGDVDPRLAQELQQMRQLTIEASDEVRRAIFSLSGSDEEDNLADDLRSLLLELERSSNIRAHLSVSGNPTPAVETVHDVVHRVVREALTNVKKHAHATVVLIRLLYVADRLDVVIQDDGVGAPEGILSTFQDSYHHFGLRHVRQVVIDRGGSFTVANGEEAGLVMKVSLPLSRPEA